MRLRALEVFSGLPTFRYRSQLLLRIASIRPCSVKNMDTYLGVLLLFHFLTTTRQSLGLRTDVVLDYRSLSMGAESTNFS